MFLQLVALIGLKPHHRLVRQECLKHTRRPLLPLLCLMYFQELKVHPRMRGAGMLPY